MQPITWSGKHDSTKFIPPNKGYSSQSTGDIGKSRSLCGVFWGTVRLRDMERILCFDLVNPFCAAEHHSCWRKMTLDLSEPPKAVSFQRPVNSEKRKAARSDGTAGCLFLAPSFGQTKEGGSINN